MASETIGLYIRYNLNGGTGTTGTAYTSSFVSEAVAERTLSLTVTSDKPTRSGYTFAGWSPYGAGTKVSHTFTYSGTGSAQYYYFDTTAQWTHNTVYVNYNANTTDTVTNMPSRQSHWEGYSVTLSSNVPVRANYEFLGWSQSSTATTADYQPGGTYNLYKTVTLYAIWKPMGLLYVKADGIWRMGTTWIKVDGVWKRAQNVWVNTNGTWRTST